MRVQDFPPIPKNFNFENYLTEILSTCNPNGTMCHRQCNATITLFKKDELQNTKNERIMYVRT